MTLKILEQNVKNESKQHQKNFYKKIQYIQRALKIKAN